MASPFPSFTSTQSINKPDVIPVYSPFEGTSVDSQEGKAHERKKEPDPVVRQLRCSAAKRITWAASSF